MSGGARRWLPGLGALLTMGLATLGLALWLHTFQSVGGSTESWLLAHIQRILLVGDHRGAALLAGIPNTTYNCLYPALVVSLVRLSSVVPTAALAPTLVAHVVSGFAGALCGFGLASLWGRAAGPAAAATSLLALLFPPFAASAAMARYDTTSMAAVLLELALLARALDPSSPRRSVLQDIAPWALAGLLAGFAHHAREFMLVPALAPLAAAAVLRWRIPGESRRTRARPPFAALAGLLLGLTLPPLLCGLSPIEGLMALFTNALGKRSAHIHELDLFSVLYLVPLFWPVPVAALGLALGIARCEGPRRVPLLLLGGALLGFLPFMFSKQQSSQYYVLAHVLLLSGFAGFVTCLPSRTARGLLSVLLLTGALAWSLQATPPLLAQGMERPSLHRFHTEAWSIPPDELADLVDRAVEAWPDAPLIVQSWQFENLDGLAMVRHGRPVTALFPDAMAVMPEVALNFPGRFLVFLQAEAPGRAFVPIPGALLMGEGRSHYLAWRTLLLPAHRVPSCTGQPADADSGVFRGALAQAAWLDEGVEGLRAAAALAEARPRRSKAYLWPWEPFRPDWRAPVTFATPPTPEPGRP